MNSIIFYTLAWRTNDNTTLLIDIHLDPSKTYLSGQLVHVVAISEQVLH